MTITLECDCTTSDSGRSARDSGTYRFKQQWGAEEAALCYTFLPLARTPRLGEKRENAVYRVFSGVWQRTPLSIARAMGPRLFARLPI